MKELRKPEVWCVDLCLEDGHHKFCVFDDYDEAADFERSIRAGDRFKGLLINNVVLWRM